MFIDTGKAIRKGYNFILEHQNKDPELADLIEGVIIGADDNWHNP